MSAFALFFIVVSVEPHCTAPLQGRLYFCARISACFVFICDKMTFASECGP